MVILALLTIPLEAAAVTNTKIPTAPRFQPGLSVRQAIVVSVPYGSSSLATVTTWERTTATAPWTKRKSGPGRVGYNGVAVNRLQNSGRTPAGMFFLRSVLTPSRLSGVTLPQFIYDSGHWWPLDARDPASFNRLQRRDSSDRWRTTEAERLTDYRAQYSPAVVLNYNMPTATRNADPSKGGAIFLHNNGKGATAGCISVPADRMGSIARWLARDRYPVIIIGTESWLKG
jgi:L,D-peptidoglycan transpeptidase YkuD (ErfK/YbiS/YcfS/YnhG family)